MSAKNVIVSICRPICRLVACILWQLPWLAIIAGGVWWFKHKIPAAIHTHFGLDQAKENVDFITAMAKTLKSQASFTNPSAFFSYLAALLERTSANAKYTAVQMTASTAESIVIWGLDLVLVLACVYAVFRVYKAWRSDTKTYEMTKTIVNQVTPHIEALSAQIAVLQQEVSDLKDELKSKK